MRLRRYTLGQLRYRAKARAARLLTQSQGLLAFLRGGCKPIRLYTREREDRGDPDCMRYDYSGRIDGPIRSEEGWTDLCWAALGSDYTMIEIEKDARRIWGPWIYYPAAEDRCL